MFANSENEGGVKDIYQVIRAINNAPWMPDWPMEDVSRLVSYIGLRDLTIADLRAKLEKLSKRS